MNSYTDDGPWEEGYEACFNGFHRSAVPYSDAEGDKAAEWVEGWWAAYREILSESEAEDEND
ncbi:hypothetical protein ROB59_000007 [Staphylococcus aureus]|jgi:ribosome modulation factor|nr:hypothetical protein [Enterococcus faecium]ELG7156046.1 hypothetical protein [Staphylococcus aureus]HDX9309640.1 hypothetical protein [Escherichia coli]